MMTIARFSPVNWFRSHIWVVGILLLLIGLSEQSNLIFADNHVSSWEFFHVVAIAFLVVSWISLRPELEAEPDLSARLETVQPHAILPHDEAYYSTTHSLMRELNNYHVVSQIHTLPFPYLSQIYHLLNLKHLETVHSNSLGSLKVIDVSDFQTTQIGGAVKFRTTLNSPINLLKIWRQSIVDVDLILHTPYTVELNIPMYGEKRMIVMFNVFPLGNTAHELFIDIYTDLKWPKWLLTSVLHLAALFTVYEDLPYLKKLSERGLEGLLNPNRTLSHKTMWLFKRFVNLHGSRMMLPQAL
jgi:hypothetical protein